MHQKFPNWPIHSPQFLDNPYQFYQRRREISPIGQTEAGPWCLTGYDMVVEALQHPGIGAQMDRSGAVKADSSLHQLADRWVVFSDPPVHSRLRRLVGESFHRLVKKDTKEIIEEILKNLLSELKSKNEVEFVSEVAYPMPLYVILKLIGVPSEEWADVTEWVKRLSILIDPYTRVSYSLEDIESAASNLMNHLSQIVKERRKSPQRDLISLLIKSDEDKDKLTTEELISNVSFLLFAGHETTVNLLGNGLYALLSERTRWEELISDTDKIPSAVEEFLRYDAPVQMTVRLALQDIEIGGCQIAKGDELRMFIGAANRDPSYFDNPDQLIIDRSPNPHLAFGKGDHSCMGATLARTQAKMAFTMLCESFPKMRLLDNNPQRKPGLNLRGFQQLPVNLGI